MGTISNYFQDVRYFPRLAGDTFPTARHLADIRLVYVPEIAVKVA